MKGFAAGTITEVGPGPVYGFHHQRERLEAATARGSLDFEVRDRVDANGVRVLEVRGELDLQTVGQLRQRSLVGEPDSVGSQVFTLRSESEGKACTFYLQGALDDLASFEAVDQVLRDAAQRGDEIMVDLTDLRFINATALRLLLEADAHARTDGHSMRVIGATGQVKRLMERTGTFDRLSSETPTELTGR